MDGRWLCAVKTGLPDVIAARPPLMSAREGSTCARFFARVLDDIFQGIHAAGQRRMCLLEGEVLIEKKGLK